MVNPPVPILFHFLFIVVFAVGAIVSWSFSLRYATLFRWYQSFIGQYIMAVSTYCGLVFTWGVVNLVGGPFPGPTYEVVTLSLFTLLAVLVTWRWLVFENVARTEKKLRKANSESQEVE